MAILCAALAFVLGVYAAHFSPNAPISGVVCGAICVRKYELASMHTNRQRVQRPLHWIVIPFLLLIAINLKATHSYTCFITLHGLPAATVSGGIFLVTTLPAPMTLLAPIVTPGQITTLPPTQTLFSMLIGLAYSKAFALTAESVGCVAE